MSETGSTNEKTPGAGKRPNVMLVLMDDMGFSDPGCYGGEIETPHLDRLASEGLRFTQFYNAGRCWPTRSCILTGYYAQQVLMDPPDRKHRQPWQRLLPRYLGPLGYRTYHSGKWHIFNTRDPEKQGGFDRSWGYDIEQHKHFFGPDGAGPFSSTAITDHALDCLRQHDASHRGTPFFHYVCYTAPHFPVQAEEADVQKYLHRYDEGWDVVRERRWQRQRKAGIVNCALSAREPDVKAPWFKPEYGERFGPGEIDHGPAWDTLNAEQRRFQATKMAIHAAMVDRTDREIGRLLDQLRAMNVYEDTLVLFLSDNGASAEIMIRGGGHDPTARPGSAATHLCLGPGWSTCSNAPFRRHKIWVHEGGISTPLIASWPNGIRARGDLRDDAGHCIDFLPTILELAGMPPDEIPLPDGAPRLPGRSLVPALQGGERVERPHLYFHHEGNRALRIGDWKIVSGSKGPKGHPNDPWALYDLATDRCEMVDLAAERPGLCREMAAHWQQCEKHYRTKPAS